jgi:radical SAM protein with 4Fe4S-binding SPASM domain
MAFKKIKAPIELQLEVTSECNFSCMYCYNYWRGACCDGFAKPNEYLQAAVGEIVKNDVKKVTITGGEPLLVFDDFIGHVAAMTLKGIEVGINTNAALLSASMVERLAKAGIKSALVSLSCGDPALFGKITGAPALPDVLNGIRTAINGGLRVAANMVVTQLNKHLVVDTGIFAASIGCYGFSATKATTPPNRVGFEDYSISPSEVKQMFYDLLTVKQVTGVPVDSLEHYPRCLLDSEELVLAFGRRQCTAGKTSCTIGHDGNIRACSQSDMLYGHINDGLRAAWDAMDDWRDDSMLPKNCSTSCSAFPFSCSGGCRVEAMSTFGTRNARDKFADFKIPPITIKMEDNFSIHGNSAFKVSNGISFRREEFGWLIFGKEAIPVNETLKNFIYNRERFTVQELQDLFCTDLNGVVVTVKALYKQGIIESA